MARMSKAFGIVASVVAIACFTGVGLAEKAKEKAADKAAAPKMDTAAAEAAMMAEMMKYATPGPEHKMFESSVGKWKTAVKSWGAPGSEPTVTDGTSESEWILGGRFLMSRFHGSMMGQPFEGFEVLGYDRMSKTYEGYWLDTMSTGLYPMSKGTWDEAAKTLTFNVAWPNPMGGTLPYKLVTKVHGPDSKVFVLSMVQDGKELPMTEVTYTRMK